jgi:hypothetical protein
MSFQQWRPYWRSEQESKCDLEFIISGQTPSSPSKFAMSCKNAWSSRIHDMEVSRFPFKEKWLQLGKCESDLRSCSPDLVPQDTRSPRMNKHLLSACFQTSEVCKGEVKAMIMSTGLIAAPSRLGLVMNRCRHGHCIHKRLRMRPYLTHALITTRCTPVWTDMLRWRWPARRHIKMLRCYSSRIYIPSHIEAIKHREDIYSGVC